MGFFNNVGASFSLEEIEKYIKEKGWNKNRYKYDVDTASTISNSGTYDTFSNYWFTGDFDDDNWDTVDSFVPDDDGWYLKKACWNVIKVNNSSYIEVRTKIDGSIYCEKADIASCLSKLINAMKDNKRVGVVSKYRRCSNQRFADIAFGFLIDGEYIELYNVNRKIKYKKMSSNGYEIMSDDERSYIREQQKYSNAYANRRNRW